jgi:hypothetical protein
MPRPSDEERKRIERRRAEGKRRLDAAAKQEAAINTHVQSICNAALGLAKGRDLETLLAKLDVAYDLAMTCRQPGAAVNAVLAQGRLMGLLVDRSAVLHAQAGSGGEQGADFLLGDIEANRAQLLEMLREKMGSNRATRLVEFMRGLGRDPDTIDGRAERGDD